MRGMRQPGDQSPQQDRGRQSDQMPPLRRDPRHLGRAQGTGDANRIGRTSGKARELRSLAGARALIPTGKRKPDRHSSRHCNCGAEPVLSSMIRKNGDYFCDEIMRQNKEIKWLRRFHVNASRLAETSRRHLPGHPPCGRKSRAAASAHRPSGALCNMWSLRRARLRALSGRSVSDRQHLLLEPHFLEKQIRHQAPKAGILQLQLADARRSLSPGGDLLRALIAFFGGVQAFQTRTPGAPAMIRHDADAQSACNIALNSTFRRHFVGLTKLRHYFRNRMPLPLHHGLSPALPAPLPPMRPSRHESPPPDVLGLTLRAKKRLNPRRRNSPRDRSTV